MVALRLCFMVASLLAYAGAEQVPAVRARRPQLSRAGPTPSLVALKPADEVVAESPVKGYGAVLGGVMLHLACGSMYCWGNLVSYLPAHLKYWSPAGGSGPPDASLVLAFIIVSQMMGMPLGPILEGFLGPRLTALLGGAMMGAGVLLASSATTLLQFVMSYSLLFGLGVGIAYQMPFITGGRWFPTKKGTVQGAIVTGMGASAFLFNMLATRIVNPEGIDAVGGAFPAEITSRWPGLLRTLGLCYTVLAVSGALLQTNPASAAKKYPVFELFSRQPKTMKKQQVVAAPAAPAASRSAMADVCSSKFLVLWLMIVNSAVSGLNIASSYKTYGTKQPALNSDAFLSLVGSLSSIGGNAAGRFFWGSLSDKLGFKKLFTALTALQLITMLSYRYLAASRPTFALATVLMLFCMGGNFAMFPAQTFRIFGANGPKVYSFLFTGFGTAALLGPVISSRLLSKGGYPLVFNTLGLLSLISMALCNLAL